MVARVVLAVAPRHPDGVAMAATVLPVGSAVRVVHRGFPVMLVAPAVLLVRVVTVAWEVTPLAASTATVATVVTPGMVEQAVRASLAPVVFLGHREARVARPAQAAVWRVRRVLVGSVVPRAPRAIGVTAARAARAGRALTEPALRRVCLPSRVPRAETVALAVRPAVALAARVAPAARVATAAMDSLTKTSPMGLLALLAEAAGPVVRP
jgi:hypothetical protein